jgi:hypothetical protein
VRLLDGKMLTGALGTDHYFFGGGMDISSTQTIFFGGVVVANNFLQLLPVLQTIFFVHLIAVDFIILIYI